MLPFGAAGLFYYLNNTHAANGVYFLSSQYANWRVTGLDFIDGLLEQFADTNLRYQTQLVFQGYALLLTPLLIGTLFFLEGNCMKRLPLYLLSYGCLLFYYPLGTI